MGEIGNNCTSLLGLLLIGMMQFCWYQVSTASCIKEEMESLLKLKASFVDPSNRLGSWKNGTNCCNWEGVGCDHTNGGHVVMLDLRNYNYSPSSALVSNGVHSSLFELKYLNHLDLSANNFNGTHIPNHFSSLLQLTHFNLSLTNFIGRIPLSLGNLTKLLVLDFNTYNMLGFIYYDFQFKELNIDDIEWIYSLSSLEYLDLSGIDLSKSNLDFVQLLNTVPSLLSLKLSSCGLQNTHHNYVIPLNSSFLSKLEHLDLSKNMFDGPIPNVLQNMTSLRSLDLYWNGFSSIEGGLSSIVTNNCHLKSFDLSFNYFLRGDVFGSPKNLSVAYNSDMEMLNLRSITSGAHTIPIWLGHLKGLKYLNLQNNSLYGPIPSSLGNLSSLVFLDISNNMLSGEIPVSFGKLSNLLNLYLTENKLDGVLPESFGQLQNLITLEFSKNALKGILSEVHFANLSQLGWLGMTENYLLSFEVKHDWVPPFQLFVLSMSSTMGFGTTKFPRWIGTQKEMMYLNLFNTNVVGPIPTWFRFQYLFYLDLSYNKINGSLPKRFDDQMPNLSALFLSDAHINGSLLSLCRLKNLRVLVVPNNKLSETIPSCLLALNLNGLDLSSNKFVGVFPSLFQKFSYIRVMKLAKNQLKGEPLIGMRNLKYLRVLDIEGNQFSGHIPSWVGKSLISLQILNLRGNMFKGTIPSTLWLLSHLQILILADNELVGNIPPNVGSFSASTTSIMEDGFVCSSTGDPRTVCYDGDIKQVMKSKALSYSYLQLYSMVNVDLSNNNLDGHIPSGITTIKGLFSLNLSHNNLLGTIPVEIGTTISLESLDLSFNQLSGSIPNSLSSLSSLGALKLSNNNFSGPIPRQGHLSTFNDASSFEGNPYLCGDPLFVKCQNENSGKPPAEIDDVDDDDSHREDELEKMWFYIVIMLGYALGFWGVVGGLILKRSWRHAYFQFMDETKDRIHVAILMNMTRLKQRMR